MQADRRLIEHVAHALQIRAKLRGKPNTLRLSARKGRRGTIERQVAQAHALEKPEAAADFGQRIARDRAFARVELLLPEEFALLVERSRKRRCSATGLSRAP
jgi:hypothetical protein